MTLRPGEVIGYPRDRMVYRFTMMHGDEVVLFEISNAALSELGKRWLTRGSLNLDAVFEGHRDLIERIATCLFDNAGYRAPIPIRIFAKHLPAIGAVREANP
ncbi:DUF1488 family protein [Bradyrhizobium sp. MOS002]|uniref:DUF1488 family protein n=1 Tax=Bradyrhizobium sp. MOS002 TaxID=2133947 RepID=UPI000D12E602|nr:DUF1488 family protein [Bradyrhizobium sp. MOS002]PSO26029.1 hypothetical protein C7G41_29085 [Bradyrhizobium sp. MOS002]